MSNFFKRRKVTKKDLDETIKKTANISADSDMSPENISRPIYIFSGREDETYLRNKLSPSYKAPE